MAPARPIPSSTRWIVRGLAAACSLLALMCLGLAVAWSGQAEEAACYRQALADGATPAIADLDCGETR